ncbi:MAG: hypothetical protein JXP37_09500 [Coriobacteriia bacterium]|nr:hypothetical protein [Coriobacteriia bacterium]
MLQRALSAGLLLAVALPSSAYALESDVPAALGTGAGIAALLAAAGLLVIMLSLRRLARGAAIAENITFAVLAVVCLAASVLVSWFARIFGDVISPEHARLGADLLGLLSMVLFGIYFYRVRRAMARFLTRLTGEEQLLVTMVDPDMQASGANEPV